MFRIALGWLGWSPEYASTCDVNLIVLAYQGKIDMIQFALGGFKSKPVKTPPKSPTDIRGVPVEAPKLTPESFDKLFG